MNLEPKLQQFERERQGMEEAFEVLRRLHEIRRTPATRPGSSHDHSLEPPRPGSSSKPDPNATANK